MGYFTAKKDNTDVHAQDPEVEVPEDPEDPEEGNDITLKVTFWDGTSKTLRCAEYEMPNDGDAIDIVLTRADDKRIWLNERFVVSIEEL